MQKNGPVDDEREATPDSDFASIVETETNKGKRASKRKADDPDHKKSYRRSWRSASPLTKLMIYFTGITALATLLYMSFTGWQLYEIRSGGEETRKLAQAARDSADAAQRQANIASEQLQAVRDSAQAAKDSASAANTAIGQNKELIKAAQTQANTSQVSARAAERSAQIAAQSLSIGDRPYIATKQISISDLTEGHRPVVTVFFDNTGKTPGLNASLRSYTALRDKKALGVTDYSQLPSISTSLVQPGCCNRQRIPAFNDSYSQELVNALIQAIKEGRLWLFVYGIAVYEDGAGARHTLKFCRYYDVTELGEFTYCAEHNSSN